MREGARVPMGAPGWAALPYPIVDADDRPLLGGMSA
jgi:hypothetical protein